MYFDLDGYVPVGADFDVKIGTVHSVQKRLKVACAVLVNGGLFAAPIHLELL